MSGDEGAFLRAEVVAQKPRVEAASRDAFDYLRFVVGDHIHKLGDVLGLYNHIHQSVCHQAGVTKGREDLTADGDYEFLGVGEIVLKEFLTVVRVEFGHFEGVVVPVLNHAPHALAVGLSVETAVDIAENIAAHLALEARELLEFGVVAPVFVGVGFEVYIAARPDHREVGRAAYEIEAEAGRIIVSYKAFDYFFRRHNVTLPRGDGVFCDNGRRGFIRR